MQCIYPAFLQPLADLDGILQRVAVRLERRQHLGMFHRADLHLHMIVTPDLGANRPHDFERETRPVSQNAAIVVVAIVDCGTQERVIR